MVKLTREGTSPRLKKTHRTGRIRQETFLEFSILFRLFYTAPHTLNTTLKISLQQTVHLSKV